MTQSGHRPASHAAVAKPVSAPIKCSFEPLRCRLLSRDGHEATGISRCCRRRGGGVATRRARAAAMPVIGFLKRVHCDSATDRSAFRHGLKRPASSKAKTSRSNTVGRKTRSNGCRPWRPNWSAQPVAVIVGNARRRCSHAKATTTTIPIVFTTGGDPVRHGLVTSLNRPGGNITGVTSSSRRSGGKRLELLRSSCPKPTRSRCWSIPSNPLKPIQ